MNKNYTADVSEEEMKCIIVVTKLILKLLIDYFSATKNYIKLPHMIKALEILSKKD